MTTIAEVLAASHLRASEFTCSLLIDKLARASNASRFMLADGMATCSQSTSSEFLQIDIGSAGMGASMQA